MALKSVARAAPIFNQPSKNIVRHLYSKEKLGLDRFDTVRETYLNRFSKLKDTFINRISTNIENQDPRSMIFSEDVKSMIYLVENDEQYFELFKKMLNKYLTQNTMRFGDFRFSSLISRCFYRIDSPDKLYEFIKEFPNLFKSEFQAHLVAMDLFYKHEQYDRVLELYEIYTKNNSENPIPRDFYILVFGAYYKLNTPESYKQATELYKKLPFEAIAYRTTEFMAMMCIKNNDSHLALEIMQLKGLSFFKRNLRILAFVNLERFDEAFEELKVLLEKKNTPIKDVLEEVRNKIEHTDNAVHKQEFEKLFSQFAEQNLIKDIHLESLLDTEITLSLNSNKFNERKHQDRFINVRRQWDRR